MSVTICSHGYAVSFAEALIILIRITGSFLSSSINVSLKMCSCEIY